MCGIWLQVVKNGGGADNASSVGDWYDDGDARNQLLISSSQEATLTHETTKNTTNNNNNKKNLSRRGPDHIGSLKGYHHDHEVELQASVLKMRSHSTLQPVSLSSNTKTKTTTTTIRQQQTDDSETLQQKQQPTTMMYHLAWNGEVYQMLRESDDGDDDDDNNVKVEGRRRMETVAGYNVADTQLVADMILAKIEQQQQQQQMQQQKHHDYHHHNDNDQEEEEFPFDEKIATSLAITNVMSRLVNAEYAFCIVTPWSIYFGRDPWGRRSLLMSQQQYCGDDDNITVNSTTKGLQPLQEGDKDTTTTTTTTTANNNNIVNDSKSTVVTGEGSSSSSTNTNACPFVWKLVSVVEGHNRGEGSLSSENNINNNNSSSTNDNDKASCLVWKEVVPGMVHEYRFETGKFYSTPIRIPNNWNQPSLTTTVSLVSNNNPPAQGVTTSMWRASFALEYWLRQAVQLRVCGTATAATTTTTTVAVPSAPPPIPIAVLFSGGVDSVVLAALTLQVLPIQEPLRLWNVSFVDSHNNNNQQTTNAQDCLAAQASYEELLELFPNHTILLETTQVSWEEMTQWEQHIRTLIHPKTTTMDLNIAMALWFASRGRNTTTSSSNSCGAEEVIASTDQENTAPKTTTPSSSSSHREEPRILLVGMGADEQLGGYGRHRKAYERALQQHQQNSSSDDNGNHDTGSGGADRDRSSSSSSSYANECLRQELDIDIDRLWERNLGRDDRIFSDHGKEARFPYLDYHVTTFLKQTPLHDVCDYTLPPGQGDKRILRLLAMRLGLKTASGMIKRAIQFGSRIAHVSDKRRFGSRRKAKGTATV